MRNGVTLIEMLIFMALVSTLSWSVYSVARHTNNVQAVNTSSAELVQAFRTAKANAANGRKDCSQCGSSSNTCGKDNDTPLAGWRVTLDATNKTYTLSGLCGNAGNSEFYTSGVVQLPSNINMTLSPAGANTVVFKPNNGLTGTTTITISATGVNSRQISVSSRGEISHIQL